MFPGQVMILCSVAQRPCWVAMGEEEQPGSGSGTGRRRGGGCPRPKPWRRVALSTAPNPPSPAPAPDSARQPTVPVVGRRLRVSGFASAALLLSVAAVVAVGARVTSEPETWLERWAGVAERISAAMEAWLNPQWVTPVLAAAGWLAPVVFAAAFVVLTVLGVPRTVLTVSAGWVFGFWAGALLAWIAALLAAWVGYELAHLVMTAARGRRLGPRTASGAQKDDGEPCAGPGGATARAGTPRPSRLQGVVDRARLRLEIADQGSGYQAKPRCDAAGQPVGVPEQMGAGHGSLLAVVSARLVPVLPFSVVNVACGALSVARRPFLLGSGIGVMPGAAVYAAVGTGLSMPGWGRLMAPAVAVAAGLVAVWVARRRRPSGRDRAAGAQGSGSDPSDGQNVQA